MEAESVIVLLLDTQAETVGPRVAMQALGYKRSMFYKLLKLQLLPVMPLPQPGDPKWSTRQLRAYLEGDQRATRGLRRVG